MDSTMMDFEGGGECADIDFDTTDTTDTTNVQENNDRLMVAGIIQMQMLNTTDTISVGKKDEAPFDWRSFFAVAKKLNIIINKFNGTIA